MKPQEAETLMSQLVAAEITAPLSAAETLLAEVRAALDDDLDTHRIIHALLDFTATPAAVTPNPATKKAVTQSRELLGLLD